jgi:RimJ/RimL family protein N-acetyltransferase
MSRFYVLETPRLLIRDLEIGDAAAMFAYRSRQGVARFQFWHPQSIDVIRSFILDMGQVEPDTPGTWLQLAICHLETGEMIGDIGLHFPLDCIGQAEIGYTVSPDHQRKGYATEAVNAIAVYLFNTLCKRRIVASVDPRNAPSIAVLEKIGFRKEAHFRKSILMNGEWCDDCVYALLSDEWEPV